MNLLLLPGNSKRGADWLMQVESSLASLFSQTERQSYAHWETNKQEIDLELETERLVAPAQALAPYFAFAKSAGSVLTSRAAADGILQPEACLFVGFPLAMAVNHNLPVKDWLLKTDFPITILQHTNDPLGSYKDIAKFFSYLTRKNVDLLELPGDSHDYMEFDIFRKTMELIITANG